MNAVFDSVVAEVISRSVGKTTADTTASKPPKPEKEKTSTCGKDVLITKETTPEIVPNTINIPEKNTTKINKITGNVSPGWHQARLPQGHAQVPIIKKSPRHLLRKNRRLASPFASRRLQRTEMAGSKGRSDQLRWIEILPVGY